MPASMPTRRMSRSFPALNGVKGSKAIARSAQICRQVYRMEAVRSMSVFATFQGSMSEMYLLPMRAMFIASFRASRKWKVSTYFSRASLQGTMDASVSASMGSGLRFSGTTPPKYLCVRTTARFTKLPNTATSSLLLRCWKSFQVKSLSLVSGALAVRTYRRTSS